MGEQTQLKTGILILDWSPLTTWLAVAMDNRLFT
jgi:hypothetical protein